MKPAINGQIEADRAKVHRMVYSGGWLGICAAAFYFASAGWLMHEFSTTGQFRHFVQAFVCGVSATCLAVIGLSMVIRIRDLRK